MGEGAPVPPPWPVAPATRQPPQPVFAEGAHPTSARRLVTPWGGAQGAELLTHTGIIPPNHVELLKLCVKAHRNSGRNRQVERRESRQP